MSGTQQSFFSKSQQEQVTEEADQDLSDKEAQDDDDI